MDVSYGKRVFSSLGLVKQCSNKLVMAYQMTRQVISLSKQKLCCISTLIVLLNLLLCSLIL